jgi:diguanylate cyclase (GGDEF)-like protein
MICVPLLHRREVVGVLEAYSGVVRNFDDHKVETLELLTDLVAAHISHATRFEVEANESRHDALTGLGNRRAYQERIAVETARATRYEHSLSVCLFDVDDFRTVNDRLGHPGGDDVLRGVARIFDESRVSDDAFRVGGDEFAILMPHTEPEEARLAAERLAEEVFGAALGTGGLGISFGVAGATGDPVLAHAAADAELLAAKQRRRDRASGDF